MDIVYSGQAGLGAVLGREPMLWTINGETFETANLATIGRSFAGFTDVEYVRNGSLEECKALCRDAWSADRALRIFLLLIDSSEPDEEIPEYAECLEELLASSKAQTFVLRSLYVAPLPPSANISRAKIATNTLPLP